MRLTISVRVATFVSAVSLSAYACGESTSPVAGIPVSLTLVPSTLSLDAIGDTEALTATVYDAEGTVIDTTVLFEPSDPSIITVTATGRVTATGVGVASVTASLGDFSRTSEVNVFPVGTDVSRVSGDAQTAVVGNLLPAPLVVEVSDPGNNPVQGIGVTFSVLGGGGSVSVDSAVTDANGQASTNFTLGTQAGSAHRVAVVAGGVGRTEFSAIALPDVPTDAQTSAGDGQIQPIGTVLPTDLGVFVADQFGNGVTGRDVNFNVTSGGGLVSSATVQTGANGVASVQWTLGGTIGPQITVADVPGVISAPLTFTATGTDLTVAGITPDSLQEGQSAQITGTGFETATANITVTVDGVSAQVTMATTTTIDIVVPVTPCLPAREVDVIVTTSTGGTAPALTKPVRPGAFVQMAVGEMMLLQDPSAYCLQFDQDLAFSNYLIGVQSATEGTGLTGVSVRGSVQGPGPAFAATMPRAAAFGDGTSGAPIVLSERQERWQRHRESEARAFAAEMAYVEALMGSGSRPRSAAAPARQLIPPTVLVGQTVSIKVPTIGQSCSDFTTINATVKAKGTRGIWLNDNANPTPGFTDLDYQNLSNQLDNRIFDVDTSYFGEPTDLDGNERIVVVVTQQLNQDNPNVLGFVSPRDVFPIAQCDASNEAEVYYGKAPGPDYSRTQAISDGPVLIAHEFAHIIQIGRRLIINQASFMSIFMAEGQATLAEEVVGHAVLGNTQGQNYGYAVAFDEPPTDPNDWYVLPFDDLSFYFGRVFGTGAGVADAPHSCSWLASNPAPCGGRPLWYGVTWSLLRWINDHFGPGLGGEKQIQKDLVDNSLSGFANIENVVGEPIETLLAEWAATLYLDGRGVTGLPSRIDLPSWDLFDIFGSGNLPSSAQLRATLVMYQDFTEDVEVRGASTAYFLLSGTVPKPTAVRIRNQVDGVLPATMQVFIVRTN